MGVRVPQATQAAFRTLRELGLTAREISNQTGWPVSTVSSHLSKRGIKSPVNHATAQRFEACYERPPYRENDEHKHLSLVLRADPKGFRWLRDPIAARFYALEWAPQGNPFWRAA